MFSTVSSATHGPDTYWAAQRGTVLLFLPEGTWAAGKQGKLALRVSTLQFQSNQPCQSVAPRPTLGMPPQTKSFLLLFFKKDASSFPSTY